MKKLILLGLWVGLLSGAWAQGFRLNTLDGLQQEVRYKNATTATVLFFLSPECPLCQSYSRTIRNLLQEFSSKGVQAYGIIPGKEFSKADIRLYQKQYQLEALPMLMDSQYAITKMQGATITPECVVILPSGKKVYQGRIDNWAYELGRKRTQITAHDLKNVLSTLTSGKSVQPYTTKAVGCFIN